MRARPSIPLRVRPIALLPIALSALAPLVLGSCAAERTLVVTSTPPGAQVRLDDRVIGPTPQRIDYEHYGIRRVTLYLEGYRTVSARIELDPPWYGRFPLDIVSEVLIPIGWKDKRRLHVALVEGDESMSRPDLRSVFERAEILRRAGPEGPRDLPEPVAQRLPRMEADEEEALRDVLKDGDDDPPPRDDRERR